MTAISRNIASGLLWFLFVVTPLFSACADAGQKDDWANILGLIREEKPYLSDAGTILFLPDAKLQRMIDAYAAHPSKAKVDNVTAIMMHTNDSLDALACLDILYRFPAKYVMPTLKAFKRCLQNGDIKYKEDSSYSQYLSIYVSKALSDMTQKLTQQGAQKLQE